jgi:hypothetical protein
LGSQLDPLPLSRVGSREHATKSQLPQLDFVKPSSWFHPVTWERVNEYMPLKHNSPQAMSLNIHDLKSRFHVHCTLINVRMIANMLKP